MEALKKLKAVALEAAEDDCQCGADIDSDHSVGECYWHQIIRLADEATLEARPSTGEGVRALAQAFLEAVDDETQLCALTPDQAAFEQAVAFAKSIFQPGQATPAASTPPEGKVREETAVLPCRNCGGQGVISECKFCGPSQNCKTYGHRFHTVLCTTCGGEGCVDWTPPRQALATPAPSNSPGIPDSSLAPLEDEKKACIICGGTKKDLRFAEQGSTADDCPPCPACHGTGKADKEGV